LAGDMEAAALTLLDEVTGINGEDEEGD
jgi:hypothetical protein